MASVLAAIAGQVRNFNIPVDLYLDQIGKPAVLNGFWERLGIRDILSNTYQDSTGIEACWYVENSKTGNAAVRWNSLKNGAVIEGLRTLISNCSIIRFADWAKTDDASGFWDGLFSDVIKPLNKRDLEFIFQLGDVSKKLVFEVDEFLDIMGDYASYGKVTLMLDEQEADQLWNRLNGKASYATSAGYRSPGAKEKHLFLFNTMSIDVLLVHGGNQVVLLSRDGQFDFTGRLLNRINIPGYNRDCFNDGYQLGLLLRLELPYCIALGMAISGACATQAPIPDTKVLLSYIEDWIGELHPA